MAMLGVSGRAPSIRSLATEKPPLSTTTIVTGLPTSTALRSAAAMIALASVNPMLTGKLLQPDARRSAHQRRGLGVELAVIDKLDRGAVGIGDVAELRIVLRPLHRLGVADADVAQMGEKAVPVRDLDGEMRRRHAAPVLLGNRREMQVEISPRQQQHVGVA